ncbi:MAG: LysM peptidoglycan-binding domain-containing protein [Bacillota bacterium]|nr:LysM peptidoglycan-binding domain-containing protein [Bacillota bacterium]
MQYTLQSGDSLWKISRRYGVTLEQMIAANPQLSDINNINVGTVVNVPIKEPQPQQRPSSPPDADQVYASCRQNPYTRPCIHTANAGQTLEDISRIFYTPLSKLLYYNPSYGRQEPLQQGTRIIIPAGAGQYPDIIERPR